MTIQLNGVQLNTKPGMDFFTQYNVPDTGLTQNTTLPDLINNLLKVNFSGKQTDKIGGWANSDLFQQNGLKQNPDKMGWIG